MPSWLEEHLSFEFPDLSLFDGIPRGWRTTVFPNETLRSHAWIMRRQLSLAWRTVLRALTVAGPRIVERVLGYFDAAPSYRLIVTVHRAPSG